MIRWLLLLVLLAVVAAPLFAVASARLALDGDFRHTRATAALPLFAPDSADGLVRIPARGFEFRARVAGLANRGSALLLLHGFPETSAMWEPLIGAAARAGFRVVAFDQRGYSPGARPEGSGAYAIPELRADVLGVADAVGFTRFHLVGHDWGSVVGWHLTGHDGARVLSWTSLSIPHGGAVVAASENAGPPAYVRVLRVPRLAETLLAAGDMRLLRGVYAEMPPSLLDEYLAVFREPGALTAALNWYRALPLAEGPAGLVAPPAARPVLYVWGNRDMPVFVGPRVQAEHGRFVSGEFESLELDAGHWLMQEATEPVLEAVIEHIRTFDPRDD